MVKKRGDKWCVVHAHPQKTGSKTDKPMGTTIKCFDKKKDADAMHAAIIISQNKRKNNGNRKKPSSRKKSSN